MSSYLLTFFALLSLFWAHTVQTQMSYAVCTQDYKWASDLPLTQRVIDDSILHNDRRITPEAHPPAIWQAS